MWPHLFLQNDEAVETQNTFECTIVWVLCVWYFRRGT